MAILPDSTGVFMQYDIQCLGFAATAALTSHVRRRLGFGLTRHSTRVSRIVVRLGEDNGPGGSDEKFCRIQVQLIDAATVTIEDNGPDLDAVIDRASDRAARTVANRLERARFGQQPATPTRVPTRDGSPHLFSGSRIGNEGPRNNRAFAG